MIPVNRIARFYDNPPQAPSVPVGPLKAPRCRTTRIGHRRPEGAFSRLCDRLAGLLAIVLILAGLLSFAYLAGVAFGAGFRAGWGL